VTIDVFTAGGATLDCTVAADGALALGVIGGNAVHSAAAALLMGARAGLVARVPQGWPIGMAGDAGLDVSGLQAEPGEVPQPEWFFHRADGSRVDRLHAGLDEAAAFGLHGARATPALAGAFERHLRATQRTRFGYAAFRAAHPVRPEHVPAAYWSARAAHLAPGDPEAQLALARASRAAGLRVTLDPGFSASRLDPALLAALLSASDVFLPSEAELAALRPGLAPEQAVRSLAMRGKAAVIAKLGARGALLAEGAGAVQALPAAPAIERDPTGAGDAFAGGLLAGLAAGEPLAQAARRALVAGAIAVERSGALALLRVDAASVARRRASLDHSPAGKSHER
jgi:hypothetical protein